MTATYIHTVKKNGRVYRYFRGPGATKRGSARPRLSSVLEDARRQVEASMALRGTARRITAKLLANTKVRARRRGLSCDLTVAAVVEMIEAQEYRCAVSGLPFDLSWAAGRGLFRNPYAPSLDRRNSKGNYTAQNCRLVLSAINYGMNEWGEDVYLVIALAAVKQSTRVRP